MPSLNIAVLGAIRTEKPVAFLKDDKLLLCDLNAKGLRIGGVARQSS